MSQYNEQDLTPVVFRKLKTKKELIRSGETETVAKSTGTTNKQTQQIVSKKVATDFDPENISQPLTSNIDLGKAIALARASKGLSQADVDKQCNFPKNTVRDYENGKAIINHDFISKLNNVLGTRLPRPSKQSSKQSSAKA